MPNFNPRDIIANLRRYIHNQQMDPMCPWYRGFHGSFIPSDCKQGYESIGVVHKTSETTLVITELPVKRWTQDYKEFLLSLLPKPVEGSSGRIQEFTEHHTDTRVHFEISVSEAQMAALEAEGLDKAFRLRSFVSLRNMFFFDPEGRIRKYENELEIMQEHAALRLQQYQARKAKLMQLLKKERDVLSAKARFILMMISEEIVVANRKKADLVTDLKAKGFRPLHEIDREASDESLDDGDASGAQDSRGFNYLLGMTLWVLTQEKVEEAKRKMQQKQEELDDLISTSPEQLWERDLDAIVAELDAMDVEERSGDGSSGSATRGERPKKKARKASFLPVPRLDSCEEKKRTKDSFFEAPSHSPSPSHIYIYIYIYIHISISTTTTTTTTTSTTTSTTTKISLKSHRLFHVFGSL